MTILRRAMMPLAWRKVKDRSVMASRLRMRIFETFTTEESMKRMFASMMALVLFTTLVAACTRAQSDRMGGRGSDRGISGSGASQGTPTSGGGADPTTAPGATGTTGPSGTGTTGSGAGPAGSASGATGATGTGTGAAGSGSGAGSGGSGSGGGGGSR